MTFRHNSKIDIRAWSLISLLFAGLPALLQAQPVGHMDAPATNTNWVGAISMGGWAVSMNTVATVTIWRDPVTGEGTNWIYIGDAVFVPGARPDVAGSYPTYPNNDWGWGYQLLSNMLPNSSGSGPLGNGTYTLHAQACDPFGSCANLTTNVPPPTVSYSTVILVDNQHSPSPFGTIDKPEQGGMASGTAYVNFGWALAPLGHSIPIDGSTITVYIDGVLKGHPTYNQFRNDIATLFPGLVNSNGAVGFLTFDATSYVPYPGDYGLHSISWNVFDSEGHGAGIGSRYFQTVAPVTTAEYDIGRTGANIHELKLAPNNVKPATFGLKWSYPVNGCVYAHPLYVPGVTRGSQKPNVVYIATSTNWVYAFDADSANTTPLWSRQMGAELGNNPPTTPGDNDIRDCVASTFQAGPSGILGTPTIMLAGGANHMWLVSGQTVFGAAQYYLYKLDIATGAILSYTQIHDPNSNFVAGKQLQRTGMLLTSQGDNYVSFGFSSYGDNDQMMPYQGWVFSYRTDNPSDAHDLMLQGALNLSPNGDSGAGVWMSGGGLASDGWNSYFTSGNNKTNAHRINGEDGYAFDTPPSWGASDYSNSIVQWAPGFLGGAWVAPMIPPNSKTSYRGHMDDCDCEIGSSRVIAILGSPNYIISGGKLGDFYILNATYPMSSSSLVHQFDNNAMCLGGGEAVYNGFAFWNNTVYAWCSDNYLQSWNFTNLRNGSVGVAKQGSLLQGYQGGNIAISANGTTKGIVWATVPNGGTDITDLTLDTTFFNYGQLLAYDASSLGSPIFTSDLNGLRFQKMTPPVIANGRVYVATASNSVLVYGLKGQ
jgi:hypothetical protein